MGNQTFVVLFFWGGGGRGISVSVLTGTPLMASSKTLEPEQ